MADVDEYDPGLPIEFGPASNGEYDPEPRLPPVLRETIDRASAWSTENAERLGMSRREFLLSVCGAATAFLALNACTAEEHAAGPSSPSATGATPGGTYEVPPSASVEPECAFEALGGEEFVFDIQGHLLEYHLNPVLNGQDFWTSFPQQDCGEDDPRACFSIEHFLELMFLRSDTNMLVLSALPIFPERSPQGHDVMDLTRKVAANLCQDERILLHAVSGDPLLMDPDIYTPTGMQGWSHVVFRRERDGTRHVFSLDELMDHLRGWGTGSNRARRQDSRRRTAGRRKR